MFVYIRTPGTCIITATLEEPKTIWQSVREGIVGAWTADRHDDQRIFDQGPAANRLYGGRMNDARRREAVMVTKDAMAILHKALDTMPAETDEEEDPKGISLQFLKSARIFSL